MEVYVHHNGQTLGPFSEEEVKARVARGEFTSEARYVAVGDQEWRPLAEIAPPVPSAVRPTAPPPLPSRVPLPAKLAVIAGAIGWLMFVALGINVGVGFSDTGQLEPSRFRLGALGLVVVGLFAATGFVLALIAFANRSARRRAATTGLILSLSLGIGIALLSLVTIGTWVRKTVRVQRFPTNARAGSPEGLEFVRAPIQVDPATRTQSDIDRRARPFYERNWLEAWRRLDPSDTAAGTNAEALIIHWISQRMEATTRVESTDMATPARALTAVEVQDPLLLSLIALADDEVFRATELTERANAKLMTSSYPAITKLYANAHLARQYRMLDRLKTNTIIDEQSLGLLETALTDGSFQPGEEHRLAEFLRSDSAGHAFFVRRSQHICQLLEQAPSVAPWVSHLLWGDHFVNQAWAARGGGYANTVTEAGQAGFARHLATAREHLVKAANLNPEDGDAAAEMIYVAMGEGEDEDMREWFDRAVKAQIDHPAAYNRFLWALRPRWHGSHEAMLAFGERCLETGRFDTDVPRKYLEAVTDIASELEPAGVDELYQRPEVYTNIKRMYEGYLASPAQAEFTHGWHSSYAVLAYLAGQYPDARRELEAIDWKPATRALRGWHRNLFMLSGEVAALTGPAGVSVAAAERARAGHRTAEALAQYQLAEGAAKDDARTLEFVRRRVVPLEIEKKLATRDWVELMPPTNRVGWNWWRGDFDRQPDGSLEVRSGAAGHLLNSRARIGPNFEAEADVELVSSSNGEWQAGFVFGQPDSEFTGWYGFRIKTNANEGAIGTFSRGWDKGAHPVQVEIKPVNKLRLRVTNGRVSAWINGKTIVRLLQPSKRTDMFDAETLLGLGAYHDHNEFVLRYTHVRVRRLFPDDGKTRVKRE